MPYPPRLWTKKKNSSKGERKGLGGREILHVFSLGKGRGNHREREKDQGNLHAKEIRVLSACSNLIVFFSVYSRYGKTKVDSFFKLYKNAGQRGKSPFAPSEEE